MSTTDYSAPDEREQWGSRVGLILAMAGNAVGLGNFLRFPNEAVNNGQGAFMVAYFISLLLLGIPLMWMEWGIGRRGGHFGYSTAPGMFQSLTKARIAKYIGALGVVMPLLIVIYYVYIESWTLGYAVESATGALGAVTDKASQVSTGDYFETYLGSQGNDSGFLGVAGWIGSHKAYTFFAITAAVNLWVLSRGLSKGIEIIAKIGMPVLLVCAIALVARVLTLPAEEGRSALDGLNIYWNPEQWTALYDDAQAKSLFGIGSAAIWLAAAGQIFFTLSVGSGAINTYSSYLSRDDDIALTGLATVSMNEFCEVVLGGTLAIPAAFLFFGMSGVEEAASGSMGLAFITMPEVFANAGVFGIAAGEYSVAILGTVWFGLLFVAGITSSLALSQPTMAFMQDTMGLTRKKAALVVGGIILLFVQPVILLDGVLGEIDYWAGTFGLVFFSTMEVVLFMWIFGSKRAWKEIHHGADIAIPKIFKFLMTFVTPVLLIGMLAFWGITQALPILSFEKTTGGDIIDPNDPAHMALVDNAGLARWMMLALFAFFVVLVWIAAKRGRFKSLENLAEDA
ncbi:MAG: sodium:calcium symporter [Planctomycetota bacterium]|nr:MAG: sodium:calcium symporter [Planctomycetota bacterium]